jgi:hypothetical protein
MRRTYLNFLLLLFLASCEGCKTDEPKPKTELEKLPPATQVGKNTFGCLVNGKAWVPATSIDAGATYQLGILSVSGAVYGPSQYLSMAVLEKYYGGFLTTTTYPLNKFPDSFADAAFQISGNSGCQYEPQNCLSGQMTLTKIDKIKYIISGVFEFTTVTDGCDTLKITNGRFDLEYIP